MMTGRGGQDASFSGIISPLSCGAPPLRGDQNSLTRKRNETITDESLADLTRETIPARPQLSTEPRSVAAAAAARRSLRSRRLNYSRRRRGRPSANE